MLTDGDRKNGCGAPADDDQPPHLDIMLGIAGFFLVPLALTIVVGLLELGDYDSQAPTWLFLFGMWCMLLGFLAFLYRWSVHVVRSFFGVSNRASWLIGILVFPCTVSANLFVLLVIYGLACQFVGCH